MTITQPANQSESVVTAQIRLKQNVNYKAIFPLMTRVDGKQKSTLLTRSGSGKLINLSRVEKL